MSKTGYYKGLTDAEVLKSRKENGVNILTPPEKESLWSKYLGKFDDPLIRILFVAGALSVGIACYEYFGLGHGGEVFFEPIGIFVAILLATGLSFYFEQIADKEFSILNQVNDDEPVKVIRNGNTVEIPKKDIVVGDIVILSTGDEVPADAELLEAVTLCMDESTLTGEPLCRKTIDEADFDSEATFPSNHVMRGTKVMEGHGVCRVFAVGDKTENGKVFEAAQIDDSVKTPLNEQLDGLSDLITNLSYLFAGLVIIGRLLVFFNWNAIALTLLIPTVLFFYLVIKKFEDYSKVKCIGIIAVFFAVFIAMVLGIFFHLHQGAFFMCLPGEPARGGRIDLHAFFDPRGAGVTARVTVGVVPVVVVVEGCIGRGRRIANDAVKQIAARVTSAGILVGIPIGCNSRNVLTAAGIAHILDGE